jgi:primosomal protein N' (replication factor Y) (superfamily II helicase)
VTLDLITVAVPVPVYRTFDYRLGGLPAPPVGARVRVPFGRRRQVGVVVAPARRETAPEADYKPLDAVLDTRPLLPAELLQLLRWTADYYQYPLGETLALALPGGYW